MAGITYLKGDATCPQARGVKLIAHVCNDMGRWGKGFVLAVSRRWSQPEEQYRGWYAGRTGASFGLGAVQFVQVESYIWVANMIAQRGTKTGSSGPPIRYDALAECLNRVGERAVELQASVHMPRIGCGLAGGDWSRVEPIIDESLVGRDLVVMIYDLE
jgi:O-acetyl-ADP-ribose deacetylase (regulator of RNase III)